MFADIRNFQALCSIPEPTQPSPCDSDTTTTITVIPATTYYTVPVYYNYYATPVYYYDTSVFAPGCCADACSQPVYALQ